MGVRGANLVKDVPAYRRVVRLDDPKHSMIVDFIV